MSFLHWEHSRAEVQNLLPCWSHCFGCNTDLFGFLGCKHILQVYVQPPKYQTPKTPLDPFSTQSVLHDLPMAPPLQTSWLLWMSSFPSSMSPAQFSWMSSANFLRLPSVPQSMSLTKMFSSIACHQLLRNITFQQTSNIELSRLQI